MVSVWSVSKEKNVSVAVGVTKVTSAGAYSSFRIYLLKNSFILSSYWTEMEFVIHPLHSAKAPKQN
jgi:hypothetical protein